MLKEGVAAAEEEDAETGSSLVVVAPTDPAEIRTIISPDVDKTYPVDENVLHVTSHALVPAVQPIAVAPVIVQPVPAPDDNESTIDDNSDGLNVLSDPRAPPRKGDRKPTASASSKTTSEPILYPLAGARSFQPCANCGPLLEPYSLSATDIPQNGLSNSHISPHLTSPHPIS